MNRSKVKVLTAVDPALEQAQPIYDSHQYENQIHDLKRELNKEIELRNSVEREANDLRQSLQRLEIDNESLQKSHELTIKNLESQLDQLRKDRQDQIFALT